MFRKLINLWSVLDAKQRKSILAIQVSVFLLSIFELFTIGSVAAYMQAVTDKAQFSKVVSIVPLSFGSDSDALVSISLFLVFILSLSSVFSTLVFRKSTNLSMEIGHQISCRLLNDYLSRGWLYHVNTNSSQMSSNILIESSRLSGGVIAPIISMISRVLLIGIISFSVLLYDPVVTLMVLLFFISCYSLVSFFVRRQLIINSKEIQQCNKYRVESVNDAFDNVKMVILNDRRTFFHDKFKAYNQRIARSVASNVIMSSAPKYLMEWLAFVSMVIIVLVSVLQGKTTEEMIPILTIYGLAAFKMLPSLQQIYGSLSTIKGNISALDLIVFELERNAGGAYIQSADISFENGLALNDVSFRYPGQDAWAIKNISMSIAKNQTIGLVGESGSGKSTLIDIICGLIPIDSGDLKVDGCSIEGLEASWRKNVSYVPQSITFSDVTIAENIAFGVEYKDIDWELLFDVVKLACLEGFISSLENGVDTIVGEKGSQLSGGQRQRIGIARALYKNTSILILDEATSALDGITENEVMKAIGNISGKLTLIIIAHRLKTIKHCDCIYVLKNGEIVDFNTYSELIKSNQYFREMDKYA